MTSLPVCFNLGGKGGFDAAPLTRSADLKVGGLVGSVAHGFDSRPFRRDLGGISQRFVHVYLKRTFGNRLACKQHGHLGNRHTSHPLGKGHLPFISAEQQGADLVRTHD